MCGIKQSEVCEMEQLPPEVVFADISQVAYLVKDTIENTYYLFLRSEQTESEIVSLYEALLSKIKDDIPKVE